MARAVQASYVDGESTTTAASRRQRRTSRTMSTQRARLDLNVRPARWRDGESSVTAAFRRQRRASRTMSAQQARLDLNDPALHDGESGINVQCGRRDREHNDGSVPTPKKDIENHGHITSASRLERSPCTMAGRRELSDGGGPTPEKGIENHERTTSTSRLDRSRLARWRERYKCPMWTARAPQRRRPDAKEGHREP
jgi:hypothetical protein